MNEINIALEPTISEVLLDFGINPANSGYKFIKEAIKMAYYDSKYITTGNIVGGLYGKIADKFGVSSVNVERCIRYAIESAFNNTHPDIIKRYFGNVVDMQSGKVRNSTFIATMTEHISIRVAQG